MKQLIEDLRRYSRVSSLPIYLRLLLNQAADVIEELTQDG